MKTLEKISDFAGKWMALIALAVAIISMIFSEPVHAAIPTSWVNTLLGIVMFGMGMTLKLDDAIDTPDSGCEFELPDADYAFITGLTLVNKTYPRLTELVNTGKQTTSIMVGPTVIMSDLLLKDGHTELAGRIVADIEKAKFAVRADARQTFGEAFAMARLKKQEK